MNSRQQIMSALFAAPRALVGMLHVGPLPGSPGQRQSGTTIDAEIARAVAEAETYRSSGFHGLMIENMFDRPYLTSQVGPEVVAAMAVIGREVRRSVPLPLGVQVLAAANEEAIAVALACGGSFVRVEGFVHCAPGYRGHPRVLDGASHFFNEIFGDRGIHTRVALGITEMPFDAPVQIVVWAEVA